MSHLVETMAYTNEVPWHGLGHFVKDAPTVERMLKLAKIDWEVEKRPMYLADGTTVPDFFALTRTSDNKVLDVVGSRYIPAQNAQVFEFFKEFVEAGGATMETAGSLKGGRYVWGLVALNAQFKMRGNDVVKGYLLIGIPHQQGKSVIIRFVTIRVVCNNTLTLALREAGVEFRMSHRSIFDEAMIARAKETLGIARDQLGEFERNARLLQKLNLTRDETIKILAPVYQPNANVRDLQRDFEDNADPRLARVMDVLEKAPGAQPGNAWGVLNAVTYYSDHVAGRSPDQRLMNAWMGKTANQKEAVLATLLEMAQ
jgi:phage/plasmid-like protein (TIGR03299 family)